MVGAVNMSRRNNDWNAEEAERVETHLIGFLKREFPNTGSYERCSDEELGSYKVGFYFKEGKRSKDCLLIYDVVESTLRVCADGACSNIPPSLHNKLVPYICKKFKDKDFVHLEGSLTRVWKDFSLEDVWRL